MKCHFIAVSLVYSGKYLFEVLTIKLSLHKLIMSKIPTVWVLTNIRTFEIKN